jgi:hypothetical protein
MNILKTIRRFVPAACLAAMMIIPGAGVAAADGPYLPPSEPDTQRLIENRHDFIVEVFEPSAQEAARILDALRELDTAQSTYQKAVDLTLHRLSLALSLVADDQKLTTAERGRRVKSFERQYHGILARAPLSLENTVKIAEATLSSERVSTGRGAIMKIFQTQIRASGEPFDMKRIDALAFGPVVPGKTPKIDLPGRDGPGPIDAEPLVVTAPRPPPQLKTQDAPPPPTATPPVDEQPASKPTPKPAPPAPAQQGPRRGQVSPVAPPMDTWATRIEETITTYEFSANQEERARSVLNHCTGLAYAHRNKMKDEYESANAMADGDEKNSRLKDLNGPLDRIYLQLTSRVESIASVEQKNRAAQKAVNESGE